MVGGMRNVCNILTGKSEGMGPPGSSRLIRVDVEWIQLAFVREQG